eukprot:5864107-Ditylum_brightwellii.AAC.1
MDPRWESSEKQIKFTNDVDFLTSDGGETSIASSDVTERMVKDNFCGTSSFPEGPPGLYLQPSSKAFLWGTMFFMKASKLAGSGHLSP